MLIFTQKKQFTQHITLGKSSQKSLVVLNLFNKGEKMECTKQSQISATYVPNKWIWLTVFISLFYSVSKSVKP